MGNSLETILAFLVTAVGVALILYFIKIKKSEENKNPKREQKHNHTNIQKGGNSINNIQTPNKQEEYPKQEENINRFNPDIYEESDYIEENPTEAKPQPIEVEPIDTNPMEIEDVNRDNFLISSQEEEYTKPTIENIDDLYMDKNLNQEDLDWMNELKE